jgi:hypothetical protein
MPWTNRAPTTTLPGFSTVGPKAAGLLGVAATPTTGVVAIERNL